MANEQGNPYAPPAADVNAGPTAGQLEELPTAGMGARLLNFIIDYIVQLVLGIIVVMVIRLMGVSADWSETTNTLFGLVTMIGYYIIFEALFGWTVGKLITGTRLVAEDDGRATFGQVLGRTLARFIPFEPLSLVFSKSNEAWHDSLSGTRVVRVRR
jgi:uncharacterized RDD family membrane protein YckC